MPGCCVWHTTSPWTSCDASDTTIPHRKSRQPHTRPPEPAIDDELLLMFLCCHPVLTRASQVALTLNVAGGFAARQISQAFVTTETTVQQRVLRAKKRLRD